MATVVVKHNTKTNAPADPLALVDGVTWDNDPHVVTGLDQVDNTSDINKPVSTAQAAAIAASTATVTASSIGLGNVNNTSDANKPVSTAQAAADAAVAATAANASNLTSGTVPAARLPAAGQLPGTTTNDNAAAGKVGEFISSTVASGSAVSLTTNTPVNVTSISLTAGDWDVWFECSFGGASSTVPFNQYASISTTSATLNTTPGNYGSSMGGQNYGNTSFGYVVQAGPARLSLAATTTVFAVAQSSFNTSTSNVYGIVRARRMR